MGQIVAIFGKLVIARNGKKQAQVAYRVTDQSGHFFYSHSTARSCNPKKHTSQ